MTIAIIDSGIKLSHPFFENEYIESYELCENFARRVYNDNDTLGHGTAVSYLICKSLRKQRINAKLMVIKCFDNYNADETKVTDALKIILNHFEVDVVNLSFGITKINIPELEYLCKEISKKSIIVSSSENTGFFSFPSILPEVYGVVSDQNSKNQLDYSYFVNSPIQIGAFGGNQRIAWITPDYIFSSGNSFACANATGIIAGVISQDECGNLNESLMKNARYVSALPHKKNRSKIPQFEIKKAAIFPLNKELNSLILFEDLLKFEIVDIYDSAITGKAGAKVSQILRLPVKKDRIIKNITDFDPERIDTLILGHSLEYLRYPRERAKIEKMISLCNNQNIKIYSLDTFVAGNNTFVPMVTHDDVPPRVNNGMMHQIISPVLCVCGTSSKQGKFTLQLLLRKELMRRGFTVGQLGTEPQSLLFSFDSVYPMGYNSTVQISGYDAISYLNSELHRIEMQRPVDIIIAGSQSSTVPFSYGHLNQYTLQCVEFLMGTCPDAVVLCVNCFDPFGYIERTINSIEGLVDCKVIAIVIFPIDKRSSMFEKSTTINLDVLKSELKSKFNIPTYVLNDDMAPLCDDIINFFE